MYNIHIFLVIMDWKINPLKPKKTNVNYI